MKAQISFAIFALLNDSQAYDNWGLSSKNLKPLYPSLGGNEDPHGLPSPLSGKAYLTSTQAKLLSKNLTDEASEPKGINMDFFVPYNKDSTEPKYLQLDSESDSSDSSDDEQEAPRDEVTVLWKVDADYGELDNVIVPREADIKNGEKESGWTNPLGWADNGSDDDQVLLQTFMREGVRFEESGYETPADTGLDDETVVNFV